MRILSIIVVLHCLLSLHRALAEPLTEEFLQQEMKTLNQAAGLSTQLVFLGQDILSTPDHYIVFPKTILPSIVNASRLTEPQMVARFLLAHEQAHQIQYATYPKDQMDSSDPEVIRVKEGQADIIGAKYLVRSVAESESELQPHINEGLREELEVSFNLGSLEKGAIYPSREGRRTATRLGDTYGMAENMQDLEQKLRFASLPNKEQLLQQVIGSRQQLDFIADRRNGEDVLAWSLRTAKRIVHYKQEAYQNLRLISETSHISDQSLAEGTADFDLTYRNEGARSINVDMEVQCITANRDAVDDTSRWLKQDIRNFEVTISPGDTFNAKGLLRWKKYPTATIPRLIIPAKEDTALVSCVFAD